MLEGIDYTGYTVIVKEAESKQTLAQTKILEHNRVQRSIVIKNTSILERNTGKLSLLILNSNIIFEYSGMPRKAANPNRLEIALFKGKEKEDRVAKRYELGIEAVIFDITTPVVIPQASEAAPRRVNPVNVQAAYEEAPRRVNPVNVQAAYEEAPRRANPLNVQAAYEEAPSQVNSIDAQTTSEEAPRWKNYKDIPTAEEKVSRWVEAVSPVEPIAVQAEAETPAKEKRVKVINLSSTGVLIESEPKMLQKDSTFRLKLDIAGNDTIIFGKVIRIEDKEKGTINCGCKFISG